MIKDKHLFSLKWDPKAYNKLSFAQDKAATKVLKFLKINQGSNILDVGCGDGKITARLSEINSGSVIGLDKSHEMINFASTKYANNYSNLKFLVKKAEDISFANRFELIFSSFALQWIENKSLFLEKAYIALKDGGQLCLVLPLCISPELELALNNLTTAPTWVNYFTHFNPNWHFIKSEELLKLIRDNSFKLEKSYEDTLEIEFINVEQLRQYICLWLPHPNLIKAQEKNLFIENLMDQYCQLIPPQKNNTVKLRIPVISAIASKINL